MTWFCGGHGTCLTDAGPSGHVDTSTLTWLSRYLRRDASVDTGARFTYIDQDGTWHSADDYPLAQGTPLAAQGSGTLALTAQGGAGPITPPPSDTDFLAGVVGPITPGPAANAVNVDVATPDAAQVLGAPQLSITYSGALTAKDVQTAGTPTRVFAQVVDPATGFVLGNQITPIDVTLDGQSHTASVSLEQVAYAVTAGGTLRLQLVAETPAYATPGLGGSITFDDVQLSLPTVAP